MSFAIGNMMSVVAVFERNSVRTAASNMKMNASVVVDSDSKLAMNLLNLHDSNEDCAVYACVAFDYASHDRENGKKMAMHGCPFDEITLIDYVLVSRQNTDKQCASLTATLHKPDSVCT